MQNLINKLYSFVSCENVQFFVYGIVVFAILYPFGEIFALVASALIYAIKVLVDFHNYKKFDGRNMLTAFVGSLYLFTWYNTVDYLMKLL